MTQKYQRVFKLLQLQLLYSLSTYAVPTALVYNFRPIFPGLKSPSDQAIRAGGATKYIEPNGSAIPPCYIKTILV
jgi:hypothetical protein